MSLLPSIWVSSSTWFRLMLRTRVVIHTTEDPRGLYLERTSHHYMSYSKSNVTSTLTFISQHSSVRPPGQSGRKVLPTPPSKLTLSPTVHTLSRLGQTIPLTHSREPVTSPAKTTERTECYLRVIYKQLVYTTCDTTGQVRGDGSTLGVGVDETQTRRSRVSRTRGL